jgi:hypothetical protein
MLHLQFADGGNSGWVDGLKLAPERSRNIWMAIATGIFVESPRVSMLALICAVLFICATRAYVGLHNPTDLLAGSRATVKVVAIPVVAAIRTRIGTPAVRSIERHRGPSAMLTFVLCAELVTRFDQLRRFASGLIDHI